MKKVYVHPPLGPHAHACKENAIKQQVPAMNKVGRLREPERHLRPHDNEDEASTMTYSLSCKPWLFLYFLGTHVILVGMACGHN